MRLRASAYRAVGVFRKIRTSRPVLYFRLLISRNYEALLESLSFKKTGEARKGASPVFADGSQRLPAVVNGVLEDSEGQLVKPALLAIEPFRMGH